MTAMALPVGYNDGWDHSTEHRLNKILREYICNELETKLSSIAARQLIASPNEDISSFIEKSFQFEQDRILKDFKMKVEQKFQQYSVSENVRKQTSYYLQEQVKSRSQIWKVSALMSAERDRLIRMVHDAEIGLKKFLDETIERIEPIEKTSATIEFEKIWKTRFSQIEAIFDAEFQWKQLINLVYRLYQTFNNHTLLDLDNEPNYLSFLIALETLNADSSLCERLLKLRDEFTCEASNLTPIIGQSSDKGRSRCDYKRLSNFEFLNGEELNAAWSNKTKLNSEDNDIIAEQKYQRLCQKITEEWPLFIRVSHFFEKLTESISKILSSKYSEELMFNIMLIQEILGVLHTLINDANLELNMFQLCISENFHKTLITFTLMSIGLFYYDQRKTSFTKMLQSVQQSRNTMQDYFLRMVLPTAHNDENVATNLLNDLCHALHQSFNREAKQMIQIQIGVEAAKFNRFYITKELDSEVFRASDDWLMRYILRPVDVLNERLGQLWEVFRKTTEEHLDTIRNEHCQRLDEFVRIANAINTVLRSSETIYSAFVDELFESSSGTATENIKNKRMCMAILFYRYLSGETTMTSVTTTNGSTYRVNTRWQEIVQSLPIPNDKLKEIFWSISSKFEMYAIDHFDLFLVKIIEQMSTTKASLTSSILVSKQDIFYTVRQQLWAQQRSCTAQCPSCRRLCDFDHSSDKVSPIGQGENQHRCMPNHQFQAMGGFRYAMTNEASTASCEQMKDEDLIMDHQGTMQQSWEGFKKIHVDWNFGESEFPMRQNKISVYIWNRIGKQLCQHYGNGMKFVMSNYASMPDHFILLFGYSVRLDSEVGGFYQRFLRMFAGTSTSETSDADQRRLNTRKYWLQSIEEFIIRIKEKANLADRMTVVVGGPNAMCINRTARLDEINIGEISQLISKCRESINFSTALKIIDDILDKIQNDPKSNTLRHTIIFMIDGKPEVFPIDELVHLSNKYCSIINSFWTIVLGKGDMGTLTRLSEIMHGTLLTVDKSEDLRQAYLKIANHCDTKSSILTIDRSVDSCTTSSTESPLTLGTSTERKASLNESTNFINTSSQQTNTYEPKQNLEDIFISRFPENIIYNQICDISLPSKREDILPDILLTIVEQIVPHEMNTMNDILIPLPIFSKRSIDYLPTIDVKLPVEPLGFNCNQFLNCLARDIDIDQNDLVVIEARQGSVNLKIKLSWTIAADEEKLETIKEILLSMNLPTSKHFMAIQMQQRRERSSASGSQQMDEIHLALENFRKTEIENIRLTPEIINTSLRMSELMVILNEAQSQFLNKKSRKIANCLMHASRECPFDYILEHALLVCNERLVNQYKEKYGRRRDNEKVLFHGTKIENFAEIFRNNFQASKLQQTDAGWYGRGFYFTNSPRKALHYAKPWNDQSITYIICSLVAVGKSLAITDKRYQGRAVANNYDSHYVRTGLDGDPILHEGDPYYEEFVIRENDRILPLFIVGIRRAYRCAIWRDANITNDNNSIMLADMRRRSSFNIYESKASRDTLNIVKSKLSGNENMNCAVITNGADEGQQFVIECRRLRPTIPVVVYCKKKDYHQQWAMTLDGPEIKITGNEEEVLQFINNALK